MRFLHTMIRVGDLNRSIEFYTRVMGMKLIRTSDNPEYQYTLAYLGYESNPRQAELELTYNYGVSEYDMGTAYGPVSYTHLLNRGELPMYNPPAVRKTAVTAKIRTACSITTSSRSF